MRERIKMNNEHRTFEPQNIEVGETTSTFIIRVRYCPPKRMRLRRRHSWATNTGFHLSKIVENPVSLSAGSSTAVRLTVLVHRCGDERKKTTGTPTLACAASVELTMDW